MRLVTRADFDGLCSAALLKEAGLLDGYRFVHPKDAQDGLIEVGKADMLVNVPYVPGAGMWFDHHASEPARLEREGISVKGAKGAIRKAPSTARVVWNFFGGTKKFDKKFEPMMAAVDKMDTGSLKAEEIEKPSGWVLLGFLMDPRTGLGRFRLKLRHDQFFVFLVEHLRSRSLDEIMALPEVTERAAVYFEQQEAFRAMVRKHTTPKGRVSVTDLRGVKPILPGNRFLVYLLHPDCHSNMHLHWDHNQNNVVVAVGKSVLNRACKTDVGMLMLEYGGGGHKSAGTCQLYTPTAQAGIEEILAKLNED